MTDLIIIDAVPGGNRWHTETKRTMYTRICHRAFATLLFLLLSFPLCAQGLSVDDFRELKDKSAALGDAVKDQNGKLAALIKVITREQGFTFDGGVMGVVKTLQKDGEIWVYLPSGAQKLTVHHPNFGRLTEYEFPCYIQGGNTYELLLNIGTGRYVTITSSRARANIIIDGEYAGQAPLNYRYLTYGRHIVQAEADLYEGFMEVNVGRDDEKNRVVNVQMQDMSRHYGDVHVTVADGATIIFQGQKVGTGEWKKQLREGNYTLRTARPDCDTTVTSFSVKPMQTNRITANAPVPHTGYLNLVMHTKDVNVLSIGNRQIDLSTPVVPIGTYRLEFSRTGFISQEHEYTVHRNQMTTDTITLHRVEYVKKLSFYFGGGYQIGELGGFSGILGAVVYNHDVQFSYTFGLSKSDNLNWYDNGTFLSTMNYRQNTLAVKYGYQFNLMYQFALTPQVGYAYHHLSGNVVQGSASYGDGASAHAASIGLKILLVPFQHCYLFAAPEYAVALSKSENYDKISSSAGFSANRFSVTIGVLFNF